MQCRLRKIQKSLFDSLGYPLKKENIPARYSGQIVSNRGITVSVCGAADTFTLAALKDSATSDGGVVSDCAMDSDEKAANAINKTKRRPIRDIANPPWPNNVTTQILAPGKMQKCILLMGNQISYCKIHSAVSESRSL
jgi:hypothetical protein